MSDKTTANWDSNCDANALETKTERETEHEHVHTRLNNNQFAVELVYSRGHCIHLLFVVMHQQQRHNKFAVVVVVVEFIHLAQWTMCESSSPSAKWIPIENDFVFSSFILCFLLFVPSNRRRIHGRRQCPSFSRLSLAIVVVYNLFHKRLIADGCVCVARRRRWKMNENYLQFNCNLLFFHWRCVSSTRCGTRVWIAFTTSHW